MTPIDRERALMLEDEHVLAITIYGEARGESIEGKIGVGNVIRNRCNDKRWPDTIREVCIQPKQFSCWNDADPNYVQLHHKLWSIRGSDPGLTWKECLWVAGGIVRGYLRDNTDGANHYHTITINPSWNKDMTLTSTIGHHKFFRG